MKKFALILAALCLMPILVERVDACSCLHGITVCEAYEKSSAVFVGAVLDSTLVSAQYDISNSEADKRTLTLSNLVFRIRVEEAFKGGKLGEVEITTGTGDGGDCGYRFEKGQRYLIYAHSIPLSNQLTTSICTRTKLYLKANEDLDFLKGLPDSMSKTRISGTVFQYTDSPSRERTVRGIKVVIAGSDKMYEIFTNTDGLYQLIGLPPGDYKLWAVLADDSVTIERVVTVPVGGCVTQDIVARSKL
jgi:hypothetical protein